MPSKTYSGLSSRLRGLARQDPAIIPSFFRYEFRRRWGGAQDRRLTAGGGAVLPALISLNPTRRCNLRCRMCFQYRRDPHIPDHLSWYDAHHELPLSAWVDLLDEVAGWRLRQTGPQGPPLPPWSRLLDRLATWRPVVYVTGGEPLLYSQILELLASARSRRLLVHLQTNGTLLAEVAPDLVPLGLQMVSVSLDGPPEVHDGIRGVPGSFRRAAQGLQALAEARDRQDAPGPVLCVRCTISRANLAHLEGMVDLALELGADILQFCHTVFNSPELVERHNRWLSPDFAREQGLKIIPPSIPAGEFYRSEIGPEDRPLLLGCVATVHRRARGRIPVGFSPDLPDDLLSPYYLDLAHPFPQECRHLWTACRILPDGSVSPCLHLVMGRITEAPLSRIWNNDRYRSLRRLAAQRLFPGCARCCYRRFQ